MFGFVNPFRRKPPTAAEIAAADATLDFAIGHITGVTVTWYGERSKDDPKITPGMITSWLSELRELRKKATLTSAE